MNPLNHVAIIMDGNGRWGLKHKNSRNAGHKAGLNTVESIIKQSIKNKIKYLTLFAFSTENWKRPKKEINYLFNLLENFLINKIPGENFNKFIVIKDSKNGPALAWVQIGLSDLSNVQIVNGLNYGDTVYILPSKSLVDYQRRFRERVEASFSFG